MEFRLNNNMVRNFHINDEVIYEEMDDQGYFFVPSTEKIIIMNESSYFLWQTILDYSKKNEIITCEKLINKMCEKFDLSNVSQESLRGDVEMALFHFENEDFLRMVE